MKSLLNRPASEAFPPIVTGKEPIGPACPSLEEAGLLKPIEPMLYYTCCNCETICQRKVRYKTGQDGRTVAYFLCRRLHVQSDDRFMIDPFVLRRWVIDYPTMLRRLAKAMGFHEPIIETHPGLAWRFGVLHGREIFFIVETSRENYHLLIREFANKPDVVLLARCQKTIHDLKSILTTTVIMIADYAVMSPEGRITVNMESLLEEIGNPITPIQQPCAYEFRQRGNMWVIRFYGEELYWKDLLGFKYISLLLAKPNQPIYAYALRFLANGQEVPDIAPPGEPDRVLDAEGIGNLERRYRKLCEEQESEQDDPLVLKEIEEEMESIIEFLQKTKSKDGVRLAPGNDYEKARVAVSKSFTKAMDILKEHLPALHLHLEKSLVLGTVCNYVPEVILEWNL